MARPRRENADYFSHDVWMRNHRKVQAIRTKFWLEWYAVRCMLLEHLAGSNYFESKWYEMEIEILSWDFWVSGEFLQQIANYCNKLWMLKIEWNTLKCQWLIDRMQTLINKRQKEREKVSASKTIVSAPENIQKVAEMPQSKVKESKSNINITNTRDTRKRDLLEKYIERWNSVKPFGIKKKWLPTCRWIKDNLLKVRNKKMDRYEYQEIVDATNAYVIAMDKVEDSSYADHRFGILDFLKQSNGLDKFYNHIE